MGYLRFFLVIAVIHGHFDLSHYYWQHGIAVFGFYVLSGFLITRVVCEVYEDSLRGRAYFLANRFVRIYPTYCLCLLIALAIAILVPATLKPSSPVNMVMPVGWQQWLSQWTIFGISGFSSDKPPRVLLATSWSLSIEIVYYLIIGLITGRSRKLTLLAFMASILILVCMKLNNVAYNQYYFAIHGPAAMFFLGSLTYHYKHILRKFVPANNIILLGLANMAVYLPDALGIIRHLRNQSIPIIFYISALCLSPIIAGLYEHNKKRKVLEIEQWLADISYPMFLVHWPLGALLVSYLGTHKSQLENLFILGFLSSLLVSMAIVYMVEIPLKAIRARLRNNASQALS